MMVFLCKLLFSKAGHIFDLGGETFYVTLFTMIAEDGVFDTGATAGDMAPILVEKISITISSTTSKSPRNSSAKIRKV